MTVTSAYPRAAAAAKPWAARLTPGEPGSSWSMATEPKPASRPAIELAAPAERGERWWPVALAIIVVCALVMRVVGGMRVYGHPALNSHMACGSFLGHGWGRRAALTAGARRAPAVEGGSWPAGQRVAVPAASLGDVAAVSAGASDGPGAGAIRSYIRTSCGS